MPHGPGKLAATEHAYDICCFHKPHRSLQFSAHNVATWHLNMVGAKYFTDAQGAEILHIREVGYQHIFLYVNI